jgi:uncharacterized membrane protein
VLLIVPGVILLGLAAGFAFASYKARRIRRAMAVTGYVDDATDPAFRRRLLACGVVAIAGVALTVAGSIWPPG